ncbi:MAG: ATP:cob(I)alamin adenosyltransferase, partial [Bacteroidetes Order II. Incertae sedis bacterium]|nr:ATP:cob(I)alamin adenosyltransferase [Bacteroidetes Order II. bacterium]
QEEINEVCIVYLNRLSDALFTAARWVNMSYRTPEVEWKPGEQE